MGSTHYKQPCGCIANLRLGYDGRESADIDYCPRHAAADELYEALGDDLSGRQFAELLLIVGRKMEDEGGGPLADCLFDKALRVSYALALADGDKDGG